MRTIEYEQRWPLDLWICEPETHSQSQHYFHRLPEVQWLIANDHKYEIQTSYRLAEEAVSISMVFAVPEDVLTYFLLKFADNDYERLA